MGSEMCIRDRAMADEGHIGRRRFLALAGAGAAGLLAGRLGAAEARPRKPNVVVIISDDQGYADVGVQGCKDIPTPHLDSIAKSGVRFTNGYVSCPVCSPTRFSIMTGKYPSRHDATNWFSGKRSGRYNPAPLNDEMPLGEVTLAEALKEHGYKTAFLGKWHLGSDEKYWPEHQGFDINVGGWAVGSPRGGYFAPFDNPRLGDYPKGSHLPKVLTDESLKILDQYKDDPFLLYLAFYSVHTPLQGREDLVEKYKAKRQRVLDELESEFGLEEQVWPSGKERQVRIRQCHAVYAAMVEAMDEQIGRVLDKLQALGIDDHTAVFLMSDNGGLSTSEGSPTSNCPLRGGKGWLYEGGIREPMIIKWPGVGKSGSTCDVPVISTDFYPTILQMAGLKARPDQHVDGVNIAGLVQGTTKPDRKAIYWHYPHYGNQGGSPGGAIRLGDWKLIEFYEDNRVELYNLKKDIGEKNDLAAKMPQKAKQLRDMLGAWRKEVDAKMPTPNPNYKPRTK